MSVHNTKPCGQITRESHLSAPPRLIILHEVVRVLAEAPKGWSGAVLHLMFEYQGDGGPQAFGTTMAAGRTTPALHTGHVENAARRSPDNNAQDN